MLVAKRLLSVSRAGTKQPLFMDCFDEHSVSSQRLVKELRLQTISSAHLAAEIASAVLVRGLGLQVAEHRAVGIGPPYLDSMNETLQAQGHKGLLRPGYGVGAVATAGILPLDPGGRHHRDLRADVSVLYVFDLISMHYDRLTHNPNCGLLGKRLFVYDFDQCYAHITEPTILDASRKPWEIARADWRHDHVFLAWLRTAKLDLDAIRLAFSAWTEPWWQQNRPIVPAEWDSIVNQIWGEAAQIAPNLDKLLAEANNSLV